MILPIILNHQSSIKHQPSSLTIVQKATSTPHHPLTMKCTPLRSPPGRRHLKDWGDEECQRLILWRRAKGTGSWPAATWNPKNSLGSSIRVVDLIYGLRLLWDQHGVVRCCGLPLHMTMTFISAVYWEGKFFGSYAMTNHVVDRPCVYLCVLWFHAWCNTLWVDLDAYKLKFRRALVEKNLHIFDKAYLLYHVSHWSNACSKTAEIHKSFEKDEWGVKVAIW